MVATSTPGRLTLGTLGAPGSTVTSAVFRRGRHRQTLVAAEPGQSVLVVGPSQSGKTSGLAIPALLEWEGPVVAASVKSDLVDRTIAWRARLGTTWVYDPSGTTGRPCAPWSPLQSADTWAGARRMATALTDVARSSSGPLTDGDFWYSTAAKLLAPLLLAAARSGAGMSDVVRWIDEQDVDEVESVLANVGEWTALQAARATWGRDERQRSAVYTTAETVVEPFADPVVAARARSGPGSFVPATLLGGSDTLYVCAPAHDQRRLRPLFATVVGQIIEAAYELATLRGGPIDPPLLVVLDEAANVAPLAELDVLAATAAGHGVQLVTVWQDLAQITARYGPRAGTIVNNHRVKVFLSGIADPATLDHASQLIGDTERRVRSRTDDGRGGRTTTEGPVTTRLAPADGLRRMVPGSGVAISGHLPPVRITLRPWQHDTELRARTTANGAGNGTQKLVVPSRRA
jgi:type IV secretion system protein VirD4